MKSIPEIEKALTRAEKMHSDFMRQGSKFPGMSYEEGIRNTLDWIMENIDDDPTRSGK